MIGGATAVVEVALVKVAVLVGTAVAVIVPLGVEVAELLLVVVLQGKFSQKVVS